MRRDELRHLLAFVILCGPMFGWYARTAQAVSEFRNRICKQVEATIIYTLSTHGVQGIHRVRRFSCLL